MPRSSEDILETAGGPTTVGELRARCSVLEPGIVLVREATYSNAEVFEVFVETAQALGRPSGQFAIVNDLTDAKTRPKRQHLAAILNALNNVGAYWAVVQPGSSFLRTVARFILARATRDASRVSVHEDYQSALTAARNAISKHVHA